MTKFSSMMSFLAAIASAMTASAAPNPPDMAGSDTLEEITRDLITTNCRGATNANLPDPAHTPGATGFLNYIGGGSGTAANAMINQLAGATGSLSSQQLVGPMSRALTIKPTANPQGTTECERASGALHPTGGQILPPGCDNLTTATTCKCNGSTTLADGSPVLPNSVCADTTQPVPAAQGLVFGLDGIVVVVDSQNSESCGGTHTEHPDDNTPGPAFSDLAGNGDTIAGSSYVFGSGAIALDGWKDVLRLLYTGLTHDQSNPSAVPLTTVANCSSAARKALAANYASLFHGNTCTTGLCPLGVKHAFRRGDLSGTTDTFLTLINAPAVTRNSAGTVTGTPFCNGLESEDKDPIRRDCTNDEQVCEASGDLGLVLPIVIPTYTQDPAILYNGSGLIASDDVKKWGQFLVVTGTNCINAPDPTPDPEGLQPAIHAVPADNTTELGYNLPTGWRFPNLARCDCRYPTPKSYLQVRDAGNVVRARAVNQAFAWNDRSGGCPAGANASVTRFGLLSGDEPSGSDDSPASWGTRLSNGSLLQKKINGTEVTTAKQRCCNNPPFSIQAASLSPTNPRNWRMDPRSMNLLLRSPSTGTLLSPTGTAGTTPAAPAYYRIHTNSKGRTAMPNRSTQAYVDGVDACMEPDATRQIGCLVQHQFASTCSVGFAGREAFDSRVSLNAEPLGLIPPNKTAGIDPTIIAIQKLITDPANAYPLARRLFLNTLVGFGNIPKPPSNGLGGATDGHATNYANAQFNLYKCMADAVSERDALIPAISAGLSQSGFIELPPLDENDPNDFGGPKLCNNICSNVANGGNSDCHALSPIPAADLLPAFIP